MKALSNMAAVAVAALLVSGGVAMAECVDTTTSATDSTGSVKTPPISKDGTKAPLEAQPGSDSNAAAEPQKDGSNMPLGENEDVATSQQDVEAQQHGDKTAAAQNEDKADACADKG